MNIIKSLWIQSFYFLCPIIYYFNGKMTSRLIILGNRLIKYNIEILLRSHPNSFRIIIIETQNRIATSPSISVGISNNRLHHHQLREVIWKWAFLKYLYRGIRTVPIGARVAVVPLQPSRM